MVPLLLLLLLLRCGDVESNPGPPRRAPAAPAAAAKKDAPPKEEQIADKVDSLVERFDCCDFSQALFNLDANMDYMKEYEDKITSLERTMASQKQDIEKLKAVVSNLDGVDDKIVQVTAKIDAITGVYDDLHEKMHEIDKTRKNNLLFYGIKPDFLPEIQSQLEQKIHEIFKVNLHITRDIPLTKISRMISGPEVRGCRPVLVNFVHYKDREEVFCKSNFLRRTHVYITEDLSRKVREHRQELQKYAKQIRSRSPNKKCVLRQDKLFIDHHMYVYDEERHEVVRFTRPMSPPRAPSRNYSTLDQNLMRRSASVHSVNGGNAADTNGTERVSSSGARFASAENLVVHPPEEQVVSQQQTLEPPHPNYHNHQISPPKGYIKTPIPEEDEKEKDDVQKPTEKHVEIVEPKIQE